MVRARPPLPYNLLGFLDLEPDCSRSAPRPQAGLTHCLKRGAFGTVNVRTETAEPSIGPIVSNRCRGSGPMGDGERKNYDPLAPPVLPWE